MLKLDGPGKAATGATGEALSAAQFTGAAPAVSRGSFGRARSRRNVAVRADRPGTAPTTVTFADAGLERAEGEARRIDPLEHVLLCVSDTGDRRLRSSGRPARRAGGPRQGHRQRGARSARISGPRNGRRYRHGPRLLRGSAGDDASGVREVKLAIAPARARSAAASGGAGGASGSSGRIASKTSSSRSDRVATGRTCCPRALPPGRYVLDVKAFDGRRNRDEKFVTGRNRSRVRGGVPQVAGHRRGGPCGLRGCRSWWWAEQDGRGAPSLQARPAVGAGIWAPRAR